MGKIMLNKDEAVTPNGYVLTNRAFINTMLEPEDVTKIMRVFEWWLDSRCDRYAPIWVKEQFYEEWLDSPFDNSTWIKAGIPRALPGSIPKGYCKSVRRFVNPMKDAKSKFSKKKPKMEEPEDKDGLFLCEMNANFKPSPLKM